MDGTVAAGTAEDLSRTFAELAVRLRGGDESQGDAGVGPGADVGVGADPLRRRADRCLEALATLSGAEAKVAALKVFAAADFAHTAEVIAGPPLSPEDHTGQEMAVIAEVACVLRVREPSAAALLAESRELLAALPLTLSALRAGRISWQHARIMVDEASSLDPAGARALEAHFLDPDTPNPARSPAGELVPSRFRAKARTWRERHHPVSIETRHAKSVLDRRVVFAPDRDGMAWFSAYLPADTASGIWSRTTTAARALQGPAEARTLTQLRADIAAIWLLGGTLDGSLGTLEGNPDVVDGSPAGSVAGIAGMIPSPRAQVLVTVPVFALMGLTGEPAILDGYGPIPPSMARTLVADGADSFHRVLTDPRDGAPLEIGRESYRVPKALRQWLRLRDGKCPFPGCSNQSLDNDADHILAWAAGGTTGISNLGQPCRRHHRLRHTTGWKPTPATKDEPPGWTSPTGRHYQSEHPDFEPPHWPDSHHVPDVASQEVQASPEEPPVPSSVQLPQAPVLLE